MSKFRLLSMTAVLLVVFLLSGCGSDKTPTPNLPPPPPPSPTPADVYVSILNRTLTHAELVAAIQKEGAVTVAGWLYEADDALIRQFKAWVKQNDGVDITLNYVTTPPDGGYAAALAAARAANSPPPYDVVALGEALYSDAAKNDAVEAIYPSDLLSNWERVLPFLRRDPSAVGFQSAATVAPIFHNDKIGSWFKDWRDLADPRLKTRVLLPPPGDETIAPFLIAVANALGKDYTNPDQMSAALAFVCAQIQPNALKYTANMGEIQQLLRADRVDAAVTWNLLARLEGVSGADGTSDITYRPMASGQPAVNGYLWVPRGAAHPLLAQLFIQWRLSDDGQLPGDAWQLPPNAWVEYNEGLLGPSYASAIPAWLQADYSKYYPAPDTIPQTYKPIDWGYVAQRTAEWQDRYRQCAQ